MAIKSFKRYEKKFLINKEQYDNLIPILLKYMDYDGIAKMEGIIAFIIYIMILKTMM